MQTFQTIDKEGKIINTYYCKKEELINYISIAEFLKTAYIQRVNRINDDTKHRLIKKEELIKEN